MDILFRTNLHIIYIPHLTSNKSNLTSQSHSITVSSQRNISFLGAKWAIENKMRNFLVLRNQGVDFSDLVGVLIGGLSSVVDGIEGSFDLLLGG